MRQCRESTERLKITLAFAALRSFESPNQEISERFRGTLELAEMVATKIAKRQILVIQPRDNNTEALEVQFAKLYCKDGTDERDVIVEYRRYEADPRVQGPNAATAHARHQ